MIASTSKTIITQPEPYCPECGAKMVLRRPKPGQEWDPFWGCSQFPDCRGTRHIDFKTGKPIMQERHPVWDEDEHDDWGDRD